MFILTKVLGVKPGRLTQSVSNSNRASIRGRVRAAHLPARSTSIMHHHYRKRREGTARQRRSGSAGDGAGLRRKQQQHYTKSDIDRTYVQMLEKTVEHARGTRTIEGLAKLESEKEEACTGFFNIHDQLKNVRFNDDVRRAYGLSIRYARHINCKWSRFMPLGQSLPKKEIKRLMREEKMAAKVERERFADLLDQPSSASSKSAVQTCVVQKVEKLPPAKTISAAKAEQIVTSCARNVASKPASKVKAIARKHGNKVYKSFKEALEAHGVESYASADFDAVWRRREANVHHGLAKRK